jgi:16S rRNA (cytidine1402-2'-O)-methyltransferase
VTSQLYIIATPLGNRDDITLRAQAKIQELEYFFVEDTREFQKLLSLLGIESNTKRYQSYASHNMKEATEKALRILSEGKSIGFLTDRGTPAISDPGALLVQRAREAGFSIVPIPGPSSVTTLMSVSGMTDGRFLFVGFLPQGKKERTSLFQAVKTSRIPLCFLESPERVKDTLGILQKEFPGGRVFFGREMTKKFESFEWIDLADADFSNLMEKGEFTLLLDVSNVASAEGASELSQELALRTMTDKEWCKAMASRFDVGASEIYAELQRAKKRL